HDGLAAGLRDHARAHGAGGGQAPDQRHLLHGDLQPARGRAGPARRPVVRGRDVGGAAPPAGRDRGGAARDTGIHVRPAQGRVLRLSEHHPHRLREQGARGQAARPGRSGLPQRHRLRRVRGGAPALLVRQQHGEHPGGAAAHRLGGRGIAMAFRIFATTDIGQDALQRLRDKGWDLEVYDHVDPPPRALILEKVKSGIDALITTLRDKIDEEVFAAGKAAGLKVVAQDAVGFDNIDRAAANTHKIPFSHTADVLTDATAEFAFIIMGTVARMTWPSEQMVREKKWSTWHPYHPWLGDEVTGKTAAVIGTGRIGKSFIKKAVGFDMDVLCHDPAYQDHKFVEGVRRVMKVRHEEGLSARLQTIDYVPFEEALKRADFVSLHVALTRPGESEEPTYHLMDERRF